MKARFITDDSLIEQVITSCEICTVGMVDENNLPYAIPLNFGYAEGVIYLHSGPKGRKLEILKHNPEVCIVMSTGHEMYIQSENVACSYGMKYKSVMMKGKVEFIEDIDDKVQALSMIMKQYTQREDYRYSVPALKNVTVMKVVPETTECKYFGY